MLGKQIMKVLIWLENVNSMLLKLGLPTWKMYTLSPKGAGQQSMFDFKHTGAHMV